jgi:hypothetical protein
VNSLPDWMNNAWVVGIAGGILSGLIVNYLSRLLLSKKENREYLQKVASANRELILLIRPGIPEDFVPDVSVLESLVAATARKYTVDRQDIFRPKQIAEELMKEVMDSSFISSKIKKEYCERLSCLMLLPQEAENKSKKEITILSTDRPEEPLLAEYRQRLVATVSMMIATLAALMTSFAVFLTKDKLDNQLKGIIGALDNIEIMLPSILAIVSVILSIASKDIFKSLVSAKNEIRQKKIETKNDKEN